MSRNIYYQRDTGTRNEIHPVWRGIGCIMAFLIPFIAFVISVMLVQAGLPQRVMPVPPEAANYVNWSGFGRFPLYYTLAIAAILTVIIGAFYIVVYGAIYRMAGPPRYGPLDVPPIKPKKKPRKSR